MLAGLLKFSDLIHPPTVHAHHLIHQLQLEAIVGAVVAAIAAVFTVHFLTRYFKHRNLIPFGIYCIAFGAFMVAFTAIAGTP